MRAPRGDGSPLVDVIADCAGPAQQVQSRLENTPSGIVNCLKPKIG